jgi:hypothetical protein
VGRLLALISSNAGLAGAISALFGIVFQMILYSYLVGRKTEKWDNAAKQSKDHESRISYIEGILRIEGRN